MLSLRPVTSLRPGFLTALTSLSLALSMSACGSSGGSSNSGAVNNVPLPVTVTVINASDGSLVSGANVELRQNTTLSATTPSSGQVQFDSASGLGQGSFSILVQAPSFNPVSVSELSSRNVTIQMEAQSTPAATALTIRSTGLPAPLPAMSPGAPAVASVDALTTQSSTQAGVQPRNPGTGSELHSIGQPNLALTVMNIRGVGEALSGTVVDLSVPGPGGSGHPIYFAVASFPNGIPANVSEVTLDFQDVSNTIRSVQGSITTSNDFDLATDTIALRPVAFLPRSGFLEIGGIHSGNAITGTGQMADFGFAGPTLNFMFMYDSIFRANYAYECTVSKPNVSVTQYIRGSFSQLPAQAVFNLRSALNSVTVDSSPGATTPIIRWTHQDSPGRTNGFYQVTITGGGSTQTHYVPGDVFEFPLSPSAPLSSGITYTIEVQAVFLANPDLSQISQDSIRQFASDISRRSTTVNVP